LNEDGIGVSTPIFVGYGVVMNRIREVFGVHRVVLPVVHPVSFADAMTSVGVAHAAGVKGVFTINQGMNAAEVLQLVLEIRRRYPSLWVGVNLLGHSPAEMLTEGFAACEGRIDGLWSDNAHIDERAAEQPRAAEFVTARRGWSGLYFGGVAFKYQRPVHDLARAAKLASRWLDVVTTSGPGTGQAADPEKIRVMKQALGDHPLAIASGVTPENVTDYLAHADCFLAATGVSYTFEDLDPDRVRDMVRVVRAWRRK
jgi:predicted TIM-barrel enzyme